MSPLITKALLIFIGLYSLLILIELVISRSVKRFVIQAALLILVVAILYFTTGFPATRQAFGGASPVLAIVIMLLCTIAGIATNYFFYLKSKFSWRTFLKPILISPIVLLPLIGSVQGVSEVQALQLMSFAFLAFQNGFFWRVVLERAEPTT